MTKSQPSVVICGAGIAGVAAAYFLSVEHGLKNITLVETGDPLSLTSDKSTEAYRNWWPGPDDAMTAFMNRSIDLMEAFARTTNNRINLNNRGYLFATAQREKIGWLHQMARQAETFGSGKLRVHDSHSSSSSSATSYSPTSSAPMAGLVEMPNGADFITDPGLLRQHFGYLNADLAGVVHVRRAGSLSAQQLGMFMLEAARSAGVNLCRAQITGVQVNHGAVSTVELRSSSGQQEIKTDSLILTPGPMLKPMAAMIGVDLPVVAERHLKISLPDTAGVIPRQAPMLIWLDEQYLPWTTDERQALDEDESSGWLLEKFPAGVHCRPEGGAGSQTILALYNYENIAEEVVFPVPETPHYPEIVLRGLSTMIPGLQRYLNDGVRPYVDGGYYIRTTENRPLIGPLPVKGAYVSGAYSGFGIMAACAGGDLIARHVAGEALPDYAPSFMLSRYNNPDYIDRIERAVDDGQL
ncbi:MAG: FAD-dependent oxidoreductase [Burkholderiaceae bacterium]